MPDFLSDLYSAKSKDATLKPETAVPSPAPQPIEMAEAPSPESQMSQRQDNLGYLGDLYDDTKVQQLDSTYNLSKDIKPDKAQEALRLADETGAPIDLIERNQDYFKDQVDNKTWDAKKFWNDSPIVAQYVSESPVKASAVKKDISKLSYLERIFKFTSNKFDDGNLTIELSDIGGRVFRGEATQEDRQRQKEITEEMQGRDDLGINGFWESVPGAVANQLPIMGELTLGSLKGAIPGAVAGAGIALGLGQLGPQAALPEEVVTVPAFAIKGGLAGWRASAFVKATNLEGQLAYLDYENIKDDNGAPLDRATAKGSAMIVGVANGLLEAVSFQSVTKLAGGDRLVRNLPFFKNLTRGGFKKLLMEKSTKGVMRDIAKRIGESTLTEGGTEAIQEFSKIAMQELAPMYQDGSIKTLSTSKILNRIFSEENLKAIKQSGIEGAKAGGGMTAGGQALQIPTRLNEVKKAQATKQAFNEIGNTVNELEIKTNPAEVENLVEKMSGDKQDVFVPLDSFNEYWQGKGVSPQEIAAEIVGDNGEAYQAAVDTGENLKIPTKRYATKLAATEHNEFFQSELKFDPSDMNEREALAELEKLDKIEEDSQTGTEAQKKAADDVEYVQDQITERLKASGVEGDQVTQNAKVVAQSFQSLAQRSGKTVKELFNQFGPNITSAELDSEVATTGLVDKVKQFFQAKPKKEVKTDVVYDEDEESLNLKTKNGSAYVTFTNNENLEDFINPEGVYDDVVDTDVFEQFEAPAMLEDIKIDDSKQSQGLGTKLLKEAEAAAIDQGRDVMFLNASPTGTSDKAAKLDSLIKFYEKNGYEVIRRSDGNAEMFKPLVKQDTEFFQGKEKTKTNKLQQAEALGFDTSRVLYHSSDKNFNTFKISKRGAIGPGIYTYIEDPSNLNSVDSLKNQYGKNVYQLFKREGKTLESKTISSIEQIEYITKVLTELDLPTDIPQLERVKEKAELGRDSYETAYGLIHDALVKKFGRQKIGFYGTSSFVDKFLKSNGYVSVITTLNENTVEKVISKEDVKSVDAMFETDDANIYSQNKETEKGKIRFGSASIDITLFKTMDRSTFIHEMGHLYLEMIGALAEQDSGNKQLNQDFNTILEYLKVGNKSEIKTEQHEIFARSFEAYMMEGNAPSAELRTAFSRFKSWLTQIYKYAMNLNVELSDDIRQVFDRIVATDEQIESAIKDADFQSMLTEADMVGMSPKVQDQYRNNIANAKESAKEEILKKHMKELTMQESKFYKEMMDIEYIGALKELGEKKIYQLLANLQKGTMPDGSPLPEGSPNLKISKKSLKPYLTDVEFKSLPRPIIYTNKEGAAHVEDVAVFAEYKSVRGMLKHIMNAEPIEVAAEKLATERTYNKYGQMMKETEVREEAMKALHNFDRSKLLRKELKYLVSQNFATFKNLDKRIVRLVPTIEFYRQRAETIIMDKKVRDLKPSQYKFAEQRASRKAHEMFLNGDFSGAFEEKKKELFNHELYRAAAKATEKSDQAVGQIQKFTTDKRRAMFGLAGKSYLDQIDSILEKFSFKKVTLKEIDKRKRVQDFIEAQKEAGNPIALSQASISEVYKVNYKDMKYSELLDVRDDVKMIAHLAKLKNEFLTNDKARKFDIVRQEALSVIQETHNIDPSKMDTDQIRRKFDHTPTKLQDYKSWGKNFIASHLKPEFITEFLDGNVNNGVFYKYIYSPFNKASAAKAFMVDETSKKFDKLMELYTIKERRNWLIEKQHFSGIEKELSKMNVLSIALNWGNQYNRDALMEGYGYSQDNIQEILDSMTEKDWKFVQGTWDMIGSFWPQVKALEEKLTGVSAGRVEATPIETKFGKIAGGYYPIMFESKLDARQEKIEEMGEVMDLFGGSFSRAMTKKGHTIARVGTGGRPLTLQLAKLQDHLEQVIHDLTHREAVIDVHKFVNDPQLALAMKATLGDEVYKQFNPWIKQIAGETTRDPIGWIGGLLTGLRKSATAVNMGFKFSTAVVQISGLGVSADEVGVIPILKASAKMSNPLVWRKNFKMVSEKSIFMRNRMSNYDRDVRDILASRGIKAKYGRIEWMKSILQSKELSDNFFALIGMMDMAVSLPTWLAAYDKAQNGGIENIKSEQDSIDYADKVVRTTQGNGEMKDLAQIQRGSELVKVFTMFYSFFSVLFNRFYKQKNNYKFTKNKTKVLSSMFLMWFFPLALEDFMLNKGLVGDESDEDKKKHYITRYALYPFNSMVILRDAIGSFDQFGYGPSPAFAFFEEFSKVGKRGVEIASGDKDLDDLNKRDLKNTVMLTGYATGLPTRQVWLTTEYFYDWLVTGDVDPDSTATGLYEALVTGRKQ